MLAREDGFPQSKCVHHLCLVDHFPNLQLSLSTRAAIDVHVNAELEQGFVATPRQPRKMRDPDLTPIAHKRLPN
jgi:hypothetical protein